MEEHIFVGGYRRSCARVPSCVLEATVSLRLQLILENEQKNGPQFFDLGNKM